MYCLTRGIPLSRIQPHVTNLRSGTAHSVTINANAVIDRNLEGFNDANGLPMALHQQLSLCIMGMPGFLSTGIHNTEQCSLYECQL